MTVRDLEKCADHKMRSIWLVTTSRLASTQAHRIWDVMEEAGHWPRPANYRPPDRVSPTGGPGTQLGRRRDRSTLQLNSLKGRRQLPLSDRKLPLLI
jgi:hypothetical protein